MAKGKSSEIVDLVLVGDINKNYLVETIDKAEKAMGKKIRYIIYPSDAPQIKDLSIKDYLLIYSKDK